MIFSFEELMEHPTFRERVGLERLAQYADDEDLLEEDFEGSRKPVLSLEWDGGPCGGGGLWVTEWLGLFFMSSSDLDPEGPFETLDDLLKLDWFHVAAHRPSLTSKSIPLPELLAIALELAGEEGDGILINGARYVLKKGKLVPSKKLH
jgi:hypothetical protein